MSIVADLANRQVLLKQFTREHLEDQANKATIARETLRGNTMNAI